MIVSLLDLPPLDPLTDDLRRQGIVIRRAYPFEASRVRSFVEENFGEGWADEISVGFANKPCTVYLAVDLSREEARVVGFAAYECTCRDFFGPEGVAESHRGRGIGKALLVACLHGLREMGYAYGIIGGVGPSEFYEKACGAAVIGGSSPGIYRDMLR